jgi:hypothetical protein
MKKIFIIFCLINPIYLSAQIIGTVIDAETKKPIEYVNIWVENEEKGTTSALDGTFSFDQNVQSQTLIFSAIGYESKSVMVLSNNPKIELIPKTYDLEEVKITPIKNKELVVSKIKTKKVMLGSTVPYILTRYLPYNQKYEKTPFVKSVKFFTKSKINNAIFKFRIFKVAENSMPGEDILKNDLIVKVKEGKNFVTVNLEELQIKIPKDGLYIAAEWITLKTNAVVKTPKIEGVKQSLNFYQPHFCMEYKGSNLNKWIYTKGKWFPQYIQKNNQYWQLAAEITLTD